MSDTDPLNVTVEFSGAGVGETAQSQDRRDELFGRLLVATAIVDSETVDRAMRQRGADSTKSLAEILIQNHVISDVERTTIDVLVERHLAKHGNDPQKSLSILSVAPMVSTAQSPLEETVGYIPRRGDGHGTGKDFGDSVNLPAPSLSRS